MNSEIQTFLIASFFIIAILYASVGFGGGSSYLAILAVVGIEFTTLKATGLLCNIVVVTSGTYIFYREGFLDLRKSWPFIALSIPLAFLGGYWRLQESTFFIFLGCALVLAAIFLWIQPNSSNGTYSNNIILNATLGACIGFFSGLVGIGGGIFLSPVLHFLRWDSAKKIAALASVFILVNSLSGLAGLMNQNVTIDWAFILPLLIAVFLGGQIGSRLGAQKFNLLWIKRITALLIFVAGLFILKDHL